jgi:hypothetical protein
VAVGRGTKDKVSKKEHAAEERGIHAKKRKGRSAIMSVKRDQQVVDATVRVAVVMALEMQANA